MFWVGADEGDEYSPVEHLAYALAPDGVFDGVWLMMLTGYFDDSGHITNKPALVVAGFVAPVGQWQLFEKDWRAELRRPEFRLDYMHMKEFRNYSEQYAKFKDNLPLETDLFKRLHRVIHNRALESFGAIVLLADYERVNAEFMLRETFGHPYAVAGSVVVHNTRRWIERERPGDRVEFVFDHDSDGWGELLAQCKRRWDVLPVPGNFRKLQPLQAADHLAWEIHRATQQVVKVNLAPKSVLFRKSFDALTGRWEGERWNWLDESELRVLCNGQHEHVPRREG